MAYIIEPREDLMHPAKSLEQEAEVNKVQLILKDLCIAHGMPEQLWSLVNNTSVAARTLLNTGYLPDYLPLDLPFDLTPIPKADLKRMHPGAVAQVESAMQHKMYAHYCFTTNEQWWAGAPHWLVNTLPLAVEAQRYRRCLRTPAERDWVAPLVRGVGRPAGSGKPASQSTKWDQWLDYCAERKQGLKELEHGKGLINERIHSQVQELQAQIEWVRSGGKEDLRRLQQEITEYDKISIKSFGLFKELSND